MADIGIVLLMFELGVEFPVGRLRRVGAVALGGGLLQVVLTGAAAFGVARAMGSPPVQQVFFGAIVSLSSTIVVLKLLLDRGEMDTPEHVIFTGPVGVGKSFLAQALGHSACRAGHPVRFVKVAKLLHALHQSRADNSFERELRSWLAPDLLILDDFGLRKLTAAQSSDFYDVLVERHGRASTALTSNRAVEEWVALFDDPILANSALDRFAHRPTRS